MEAVVVYRGEDHPRVIDIERPSPEPGEALVKTHRVGIDGTDHEVIAGRHGGFPEERDYLVLGHEAIGMVVDPNGTSFEPGELVVPTVRRPPNESNAYFRRGEPDMAPEGAYVERGIVGAHGFMSEYFTSPEEFLVTVPDSLRQYGFLVEPMSNTEKALEHAHAARSAFEWCPERALVLGNGPLGLLTLGAFETRDAFDRTYCLGRRDRPDPTIDIIERFDSTYIDSRATPVSSIRETVEPMDLVFEATGVASHAFEAVEALAPNGIACLLGIPDRERLEIDAGRWHRTVVLENKALIGSVNSSVPHFEAAIDTVERLPTWFLERLVTDCFGLEEIDTAFANERETIKAVVEFPHA